MGMEFSATEHLSPIHKQSVGISTGASYRAHIVSSKMNKHYHSMKTSYLLELFFPLFFSPPLTPLFSGSGLCPWGRGGVFSLQKIVELAQIQAHRQQYLQ